MKDDQHHEGVSMKEVEHFVKTHWVQLFLCLLFVLTFLFSLIGSFKPGLSLFLLAVGGIVGLLRSHALGKMGDKLLISIGKQEKGVQMILAGVSLVIACALPFIIVFLIGILSGLLLDQMMKETPFNPMD